jgi:SOS-response transcriptional repressor LexA
VADLIGCAKSYVSEIETGKRAVPSDEVLVQIEGVMMLAPGTLVERAQWERGLKAGGPAVGRAIDRMQQENEAGRKLAELLRTHAGQGRHGLDELYRTGQLQRLLGEISPMEGPPASSGSTRDGRGARSRERSDEVLDADRDPTARSSSGEPSHLVNIARLPRPLRREVPLINAVSAGYPREFTDMSYPARVADEYVQCPDVEDPDAFAARVVGDSMMPDYRQGDVIVFSPGKVVKNGHDCFVRLERDAETTFKRVYFETGPAGEELIRLQPINNTYAPKVFPREDIAGLYVAVKAIREI